MATRALTYTLIGQDKLSPVVNKAGKNTASISSTMQKSLKKAALAFAAVGVAATGAAVKMATDYQSSMQKIVGLVGISQKQVNAWSKQILALASNLPQSPKELADAMFYVTSAGLRGKTALDALTASARAAAAGLGDTKTVADAVTSAMNAYGAKNLSASKATDILTAAVKDGKLEASSLAPVIGNVIPLASELGVSFDQLSAAIAAMSTTGQDAATAATSVQAILSGLLKPSTAGAAALKQVGLSYAGIRDEIKTRGLFSALMDVKGAFGGNNEALAKVIPNVRALRGFLSLTGQQAGNTKAIFNDLAKSTGTTDKAFKAASQTADFKMKSALSSLQVAAINMGSAMLPIVAKMADAFSKLLAPIAQNKAAFATLAVGVMAFAVTSKVAMAMFATGVKAALITSVVGVAILGLSVAITELLTHWNTVWNTMKHVTEVVANAFKVAFDAVKKFVINDFVHPVVSAFLNFAGWITHAAASAFGWVPGLGGSLKKAAKAFDQFKDNVNASLDKLGGKTISVGVNFATAWQNSGGDFIGRGNISGRAAGGPVTGPGSATSDSVPAMLSNGEYVVNAKAHSYYGTAFLNAVNAKRLAAGGVALKTYLPKASAIAQAVSGSVLGLGQAWVKNFVSMMNAAGSGVQRWASLVLQVLSMLGQSPGWLSTVLRRMNQESGGNPYAINLWDINAKHGDPSRGLMQVIGSTFAAYGGPFRSLGIYNPLANVYAGLNYALHRYGSLAALNRPGGYDMGGVLKPGYTLAYNGTGHNEYVVNPSRGMGGAVTVNLNGTFLGSKQEVGRAVADALTVFGSKGGSVPYVKK